MPAFDQRRGEQPVEGRWKCSTVAKGKLNARYGQLSVTWLTRRKQHCSAKQILGKELPLA
eukprot:6044279-Pleurochrysis_carterae.AAC.2